MQATGRAEAEASGGLAAIGRFLGAINPLIFVIVLLYIGVALLSDRFLALHNQMNITRQVAVYLIIALGQTFVISSRGIDLSVGSMLGLCGAVVATQIGGGTPQWLAMLMTVALGTALGAVNGAIITQLRISPLIATLGMLVTLRGATHLYYSHLYAHYVVSRLPPEIVFLGQGFVGPVPLPAILAFAMVAVAWYLFYYTRFGSYTTSIGSNEQACSLAGIHVNTYKVLIYAFQGLCVGIAAVILVGRLNGASPVLGTGYELHIIAAVVLGGTALFGGIGSILGTVLGIFTIGIVENGMVLIGADFHMQRVLIGLLLIAAVAYQGYRRRRMGTAEE
jgi:ribose/xylose/arabinose/galactoside ABC-type transport system permease subunit